MVVNMVWFIYFMEIHSKQNCPVSGKWQVYVLYRLWVLFPSHFETLYQGARMFDLFNHSRIMFMIRNYSFTHFLPSFCVWRWWWTYIGMALLSYLLFMKSNQVSLFSSDVNYNSVFKVFYILTAFTGHHQTLDARYKVIHILRYCCVEF